MDENLHYWFRMNIRRARKGTIFTVKVDPRVEDFFKGLGNGNADPLEMYGRTWLPTTDQPIQVYNLHTDLDPRFRDRYTVNHVSGDMSFEGVTNLSFLRFVGVSEGEGVSFLVALPLSLHKITTLKNDILDGVRAILYEHIVPTNITLELVSKEG